MSRLLVAEDDANIRNGLMAALESEGHDVVAASDGAQALKLFPQGRFELVILDVMMPKLSGYDVCRELRRLDARVPILFLTSKAEELDKVVGLKLGADDYVTKPFGVHELLARVEALVRRSKLSASPDKSGSSLPATLGFGAVRIDRKRFLVVRPGGAEEALTARELKLAEVFAEHPDEVLTRDALLNAVWGVGYLGTTRTLDQHVAQLRKKVELDPESPTAIHTVHGVGYRYSPVKGPPG